MAEIAIYRCSNPRCKLTLRLSRDFPLWQVHTPQELKSPSNGILAKEYVLRYRSESFCTFCKIVVEYTDDNRCYICKTEVPTEHIAAECPRCKEGALSMPHLLVY